MEEPRTIPADLESQITVLGSASMQCDSRSFVPNKPYIRLTKALPDQRGGVYCKETIYLKDGLKGLEIEFAFRITDGNGSPAINGADGFAFVIQAQGENALGLGGCELGFGGITNWYNTLTFHYD
jgi:peptide-N4-(N-acetyl-beta-glucosaminyl)asparagine amidase